MTARDRSHEGRLLDSTLPIVAAPMAGGPTTPALVRAVADAGGFGLLAGGYKTPDVLASEIAEVRAHTSCLGVNLFVPGANEPDRDAFGAYAAELRSEAEVYGIGLDSEPVSDDDWWPQKLALLVVDPVPLVSLTFALPDAADVAALQRAGTAVLATVTTPTEARDARAIGVDGLVVQGAGAGGHSGTHDPNRPPAPIPTDLLVRDVRAAVELPVIATGGVDGPASVHALLCAGADAVAVGTLLLRTDEAGTSSTHRAALADDTFPETVLTHAFTGRPARALRNGFIDRHHATAPVGYPAVHHLTRALRQAAARAGDTDRLHLWAGTGYRSTPTGPASDVVRWLAGT